MDDSRKPDGSSPTKFPWQNEEGSGENLGATGVFGTPLELIHGSPGPVMQVGQEETSGEHGELQKSAPPAAAGSQGLQEPIVHKVVLGGGSATAQVDLLELLRANSPKAEPAPGPVLAEPQAQPWTAAYQPTPVPPSGSPPAQSSEGFTQLLRALSGDVLPPSIAKQPEVVQRTVASSDVRSAIPESGFTALVRQSTDDLSDQPEKRSDLRAPTPGTPPSDGPGGFTALLQGFSGSTPNSDARRPNSQPFDENPLPILPVNTPAAPVYTSGQATPGAFTQLFSMLTSEPAETNSGRANTPAVYSEQNPVSRPSGEETLFTQLISTIGEGPYKPSTGDNRPPIPEDFSPRPSAKREDPVGSSQLPTGITDWSRAMAPQRESSPAGGGLTQLLRTLDEPVKGPEMPIAYPPADASAPTPRSGSLFTQTYKKLDEPVEPLSPTPPPSYSPPSNLSATQPFASPFTGGTFPDQRPAAPVAPNLPAGPSDVTRILDASKLREMQRGGPSAPAPANSLAPPQPLPAQLSAPVPPALPNLQWQPPVSPPAAWQPPQYAPAAVPAPQLPAPAPVAAPSPALPVMGKLQQYLPLLLIIIIFLLIVILVTVVFLLKH